MNSDLHALLTLYYTETRGERGTILSVVVSIKDGLNNFPDWEYFNEEDVHAKWLTFVPGNLRDNVNVIGVESVYDVVTFNSEYKVTETTSPDFINVWAKEEPDLDVNNFVEKLLYKYLHLKKVPFLIATGLMLAGVLGLFWYAIYSNLSQIPH